MGPLGEDPGFRGYALPLLQASRPPLLSAAILGVLVALWHLPLVLFGGLSLISLPTTFAITFLYVLLFNRTGGSVLLTLLFHNSQGTFTTGSFGFTGPGADRAELIYFGVVVLAVLTLCGAGPPGLAQGTPPGHRRRAFLLQEASQVNDGGQQSPCERRLCTPSRPGRIALDFRL
ncbi:CPBP family intramembrane glutamic endopeptidase [Pseudarthrobacter sp. NIBRBAC000502772]|uniref:CPBP family intramembrane glutamic endopeptidase n=1 Tax=Pseudarthrobacter sp. NIBRBAC000502772 TaxID=2590775 RepID=UPI00143E0DA4|nr:CPBP family intramembrane glutamic endopeptidase [Pseudarthrobacter sp. NIBRBAC000502772]